MSRRTVFLGLVIAAVFSVFNVHTAFAEIAESSPLYQKAFYEGVVTCFDNTVDNGGLIGSITLGAFDGSINTLTSGYRRIVKTIGDARYASISCKDLFTNKTEKKLSTTTTSDATVKEQRLVDANYTKGTANNSDVEACYSFKYKKYTIRKKDGSFIKEKEYYTPQLCISKNANGLYVSSVNEIAGQYDSNESGLAENKPVRFKNLGENKLRVEVDHDGEGFLGIYTYTYSDFDLSTRVNESQVLADVGNFIASIMGSTLSTSNLHKDDSVSTGTCTGRCDYTPTETWKHTYYSACQNFEYFTDNSGISCTNDHSYDISYASQAGTDTVYNKFATRNTSGFSTVISNFSNGKYNYSGIKYTADEIYQLYQYYLTDIYEVSNINCSDNTLRGAGEYNARLWWNTQNKYSDYCYFDVSNKNKDIKVNGVYDNGIFGNEIGLDELISKLNSLSITDAPGISIYANTDQTDDGLPDDLDSSANDDACWNAGIESMAWVLCPTLNNTATTVSAIDKMTASWLEVDSDYYNNSSASHGVWEVMRNIANVIMVVFLLAVILSQLTGYGIDNYGIKKMLPKIITMAILLNLSFVICQLAIDGSNVLGHGLNILFRNIAIGLFGEHDVSNIIGWAGAGIFATLGVAGTFAGTAITVATAAMSGGGVMAVIVIVLAVLTALLAILLFFVMLGARMIIVILCIAIAPVAFACYVFPNTQNYFKKWWDLFKAALVIYPICGALGGISYLIKLMVFDMQSNGVEIGFFMYLMAMLTPFLPFFVLPSLLKNSIAALGKIGGALTSMGNFVRNGVHGTNEAVRNTNSAKSLMQRGQEQAAVSRARRIRNRLTEVDPTTGRRRARAGLSAFRQSQLRSAEDTLLADRKRTAENERRGNNGYFDAMIEKQEIEGRAEEAAVAQYSDPNYREARIQGIEDEARKQRSKDRTILALSRYQNEGLQQLQARWDDAFRTGNRDELDALSTVMISRYGSSAANSIGQSLNRMTGIASNTRYQASMRQLQQTMTDNSNFAGHMKNKASDAFQMISEAGTHYDHTTGTTTFEDLSYFSRNNATATDIKDWSTQSGATLQRALDSGALTDDMVEALLTSTDPSVQSGIQSDRGKRDILQAHMYNRQHNPHSMGPNPDTRTAAQLFRQEQTTQQEAQQQAAQQQFNDMTRNIDEINQKLSQRRRRR